MVVPPSSDEAVNVTESALHEVATGGVTTGRSSAGSVTMVAGVLREVHPLASSFYINKFNQI